jgi:hypothetical protein
MSILVNDDRDEREEGSLSSLFSDKLRVRSLLSGSKEGKEHETNLFALRLRTFRLET